MHIHIYIYTHIYIYIYIHLINESWDMMLLNYDYLMITSGGFDLLRLSILH